MICDKIFQFPKWDENDNNSCVVDYCANIMLMAKQESCGKSVLCREGTWQVYEIIKGISEGDGRSDDVELLKELVEQIKTHGNCQMSKDAATICFNLIEQYEDEWNKHLKRKICSNMVCKGLKTNAPIRESSDNQEGRRRRRRGE